MNYYEHHLGDYAQATAHLSFVEDSAYGRLLRKYYADEKPLPAELRAVQRLVGARTEEEREAVQVVLEEFFILESDGWHNKRADAEIAKFNVKKEKARKSAEARWNANASEIDANASESPCERIANASPKHDERNALQSPDTNISTSLRSVDKARKRASTPDCPDDVDPQTWGDWLALRRAKKAPVTQTVIDQAEREAAKAGLTLAKFLQVWCARGSQGLQADWLKPNERGGPHLGPPSTQHQPSKTFSAVQRLQSLKSNANHMDPQRDFGRPEPVALLGPGSDSCDGFDRGDRRDVG